MYYNYERPECGEGNGLLNRRRTGVIRLADSDDIQGNNFDGSDFLLVEVEDEIPSNWDVYYAGWDASGSGSGSGVGIHHPSGDVKKVSTYTQNTSSISLGAFGSHWRVYWVETVTDHGVTEGGSSGSHLFNEEGLSIGTLSAGLSACSNGGAGAGTGPNQPDYYGKMSYHWDDNPNPADESWNCGSIRRAAVRPCCTALIPTWKPICLAVPIRLVRRSPMWPSSPWPGIFG